MLLSEKSQINNLSFHLNKLEKGPIKLIKASRRNEISIRKAMKEKTENKGTQNLKTD